MNEKWLHRSLFCISFIINKVDHCVRVQQQMTDSLCWKIGRRGVREMAWFDTGHLQYRCFQFCQVRWKSRFSVGLLGSQNFSSEWTHQRRLPFCYDQESGDSRSCAPAADSAVWKPGSLRCTWFQDYAASAASCLQHSRSSGRLHLDTEISMLMQEELRPDQHKK